MPFGNGLHACPGRELAKLEMLILIHHLLTNFRQCLLNVIQSIYGTKNGAPIDFDMAVLLLQVGLGGISKWDSVWPIPSSSTRAPSQILERSKIINLCQITLIFNFQTKLYYCNCSFNSTSSVIRKDYWETFIFPDVIFVSSILIKD